MTTMVSLYLGVLSFGLLAMMFVQYVRGTHDALSFRNLIILGFIVFQSWGAIGSISGEGGRVETLMSFPGRTSFIFAVMCTTLLVTFFWAYRRGFLVTRWAELLPTPRVVPGTMTIWLVIAVLIFVSYVLRIVAPAIGLPLLTNLAQPLGSAFSVAACALLGWIWGPRLLNPVVVAGVGFCLLLIGVLLLTQVFGRRTLVAAGAALVWGLYYSHFRYRPVQQTIWTLGALSLGPILFVAAFTSARQSAVRDRTAGEQLTEIRQVGNVRQGLRLLMSGQDAGQNALWLIEQYPGPFETRPLFSIYYVFAYPVPREWWMNKPEPLSTILPHWAMLQDVNRDQLTIGPGVIGHAVAEGGWIALLIYGIVGGLFVRFLDEVLRRNAWSPFLVAAAGSSFGHYIGIPRGEISAFVFLFLLSVVGTFFSLLIIARLLEYVAPATAADRLFTEEDEAGEWGDDAWPGDASDGRVPPLHAEDGY